MRRRKLSIFIKHEPYCGPVDGNKLLVCNIHYSFKCVWIHCFQVYNATNVIKKMFHLRNVFAISVLPWQNSGDRWYNNYLLCNKPERRCG